MAKMTPHHGLTPAQVAGLRARLVAEQDRIRRGGGEVSPIRETPEPSADIMDEAETSFEQHQALGQASRDRSRLAEVDRALARLDDGTYGISELSGEPIGFARLNAVPWARYTAAEQEQVERRSQA